MDSNLDEVVVECVLRNRIFQKCAYSNFRGLSSVSVLMSSKI